MHLSDLLVHAATVVDRAEDSRVDEEAVRHLARALRAAQEVWCFNDFFHFMGLKVIPVQRTLLRVVLRNLILKKSFANGIICAPTLAIAFLCQPRYSLLMEDILQLLSDRLFAWAGLGAAALSLMTAAAGKSRENLFGAPIFFTFMSLFSSNFTRLLSNQVLLGCHNRRVPSLIPGSPAFGPCKFLGHVMTTSVCECK